MSVEVGAGQVWASGEAYERYVGRWSRLVARELLDWLDVPAGARWLDVGCGTGALSATILAEAQPAAVTGVDSSEAFVAHARATTPAAHFVVADARQMPFPDRAFDAVVSGLVLNFVPEPERAAAEMARVAAPGAVVAAYVWDYGGEMQLMRSFWDAAAALDPAARELDEGLRFRLSLDSLWREAGLTMVEARAIDVPTVFEDFDDYWSPFLGGQGPAPAYAMSLDEPRREALRERLRSTLPAEADGTIRLVARALVVRGTPPS
jgi:SAM-dependent methyltransferase